MSQSLDSLFWTSHDNFLRKLQEGKASTSLLNDHFEWLLYGTQKFKPSNESSRKQIIGNAKLEFKGKPFLYNAKLRPLVLRAAKLLDLDEIQAILLLRRWVKNHDINENTLQENDPATMNTMVLQVLKYYNLERHLLLKSIQVVLINEADGGTLADLRSRLINANVEEQLHARLRENVESGAAAISRRLRAGDAAAIAGAAGADVAAAGTSTAVSAASTGFITTAATLDWLKAAKDEMQTGLIRERIELLNCMLLLYERCRVACKPERALALARLLLDRVFASVHSGGAADGGSGSTISFTAAGYGIRASAGNPAAEADVQHSRMLAALLLMSCLDLPGHVLLTAGPSAASGGGGAAAAEADEGPPLGGKTMDLHNQISQYAAMPETALLLLTWVGCLRLLDLSGSDSSVRDLDAATRDLEGRVAAMGGLAPAVAALKTACDGAFGIVLLQYRGVARKALCVLCTAFDLGADSLNPAMYETVEGLLKLCLQDDIQACTDFWDESVATMAPLRSLRTGAVRLFPVLLHPLLVLLRLTAVSAATASRAYAFLQEKVSLMVVHTADEPALKHLEDLPNEVLVDVPLPWNLAPTVEGMVLPEEMPGTVLPMPPVLSALQGGFIMVEYAADVNGNCPQSRGQVLLLSRAVYCVAALEHALRHNLPLERSLFRDLSDTFSLLGSLCALYPDNLSDIMAQSVTSSGACRDWLQVTAGVLAIGPQLAAEPTAGAAAAAPVDPAAAAVEAAASLPLPPPQPLHLMADAAKLLAAMVAVSPGRVLQLLPQLPLLSSPGGDLLTGLPPSVAMDALPTFTVPPRIDSFCGLLPLLSAVQRDLERPTGRYPLTVALLSLLAELLERGFVAAPLPVVVLFVMYELLPSHHHWHYESPKERWTLTRGLFRILRLALTAGAYVSDPDISALAPAPPPASSTAPARGSAGAVAAGGGALLLLTYAGECGGGGAGGGGGGGSGGSSCPEEKGATLTPDDILQAAVPRLHVSLLSAAVLKLLLLHGPVLLARCLPPPADVLEQLQREDPGRPELPVLEDCAAELVKIIPPLLAAAGTHPQEQPFEEYLFGGRDPTPAAHLVSYITYAEVNQDMLPPQQQISYFAMRALLSIAACVARPVSRSLPGVSLALAVPVSSSAESCLCSLLRGTAASEHPELYAVATQLAAEAVANHPEVLDALLFPASLEHQQQQGSGVALPLLPAPPGAAGGAATGQGAARQWAGRALDGLYAMLQNAGKLKQEQPQVLACALRVLAAMWRQPTAASRPVSLLRSTSGLWRGLEACLGLVASATSASPDLLAEAAPGANLDARAQGALCEAYALQILTAEAFAQARFPGSAGAAAANGGEAQAVLDRLVRGGGLLRLLRAAAEPVMITVAVGVGDVGNDNTVEAEIHSVGSLQHLAAALELSLGPALWNTGLSVGADDVSIGPTIREELSGVRSLMDQGMVSKEDLQSACSHLWMGPPPLATAADPVNDVSMPQEWHTNPLRLVLQRQCIGAALINRCHASTTDLAQLPDSPTGPVPGTEQLLSRARLAALLPNDYQDIMEPAVGDVNTMYSLGEALVARLQAVCTLTSVLAQGGRLLPDGDASATVAAVLLNPPMPAGSSAANEPATPSAAAPSTSAASAPAGLLTTVQLVCWTAVSGLVAWCASKDSRAALQSDWGLRRLHAHRIAAALTAARLLLSVMQGIQKVLAAAPPAATAGGTGSGGGFSTPTRGPGPVLSSIFGTPIALTPLGAAPPRSGRHGAAGGSTSTMSGGGGGGISADPAYLPFVASLTRQWAVWARAMTGRLPQCPPAAAEQITDAIGGALLLALRSLQPESAVPPDQQLMQAADRQLLAASLRSTLTQLCDLAASGSISTSLAAQLLLESTRHLAIKDWLPQLFNKLDLGEYIRAAANRAAELATAAAASGGGGGGTTRGGTDAAAAAGDLGMLSLAVAVAQVPEGAYMLYEQDIVENLVAASRQLLSGSGGRLAAFSVIAVTGTGPYKPGVDGTYASTAGAAAAGIGGLSGSPPPDTCGAYLLTPSPAAAAVFGALPTATAAAEAAAKAGEVWSPVHRQWCTLLQFSGSLVKTLGQRLNIERGALDLLLAMEPRLMLAVLPPGGDVRQPLTLAGLVEMEAALFLLIQMTAYTGGWHMLLPSSLLNFRTAVSTLLTWLAQPNLVKSFSVDCRPRTTREVVLAGVPAAGVPCSDGWFRICTLGTASSAAAATGPNGSVAAMAGAGGLGSPIFGSIPTVGSLSRGLSDALPINTPGLVTPIGATRAAGGLGLVTPGGAGRGATPGASGGGGVGGMGGVCSEYSAQMAEKLYTCAQHALTFLVASSPQLSQGEAATLGPAWPRPQDLSALLDQCMCASESLAGVTAPAADVSGTHDRRTRLMHLLGRVGQLCSDFNGVLAAAGSSNAFGATAGVAVREQLAREWLASLQAGPLGASASGFGSGVGMQAVPAS